MGEASRAVTDFCRYSREEEFLRTRRKAEKQQACETRKAAEQLLVETLGDNSRYKISLGDDQYAISVKSRDIYPSFTSSVADRLEELWNDSEALRIGLLSQESGDIIQDIAAHMVSSAVGPAKKKHVLEVTCIKRTTDEMEDIPPSCADLAVSLVRAKTDLRRGSEEHKEESKRVQTMRAHAEQALVSELSSLPSGQHRRITLLESDGSAQAYYLRLKPRRAPLKKKVTVKVLKKLICEALANEIDGACTTKSIDRVCSDSFKVNFLSNLKSALEVHELSGEKKEGAEQRVALDRIRVSRTAQSNPSALTV